MKRFLLCFLSVPLMLLLPAAADRLTPRREALVKVCIGGETKELSAEEYVASAVAACPTASEPAAREALAVVIRTNVMHARLYGTVHEDFLFCDDPGCCFALAAPGGEAVSAASATSGRYLVRDGLPVELPFSECCGSGSGEGAGSPFSAAVAAASPCEVHRAERRFTLRELSLLLGITEEPDEECFVFYGRNKKCEFAVFGTEMPDAERIMRALSLPSREFTLDITGGEAVFDCRGLGSGLGLDLCYASRLAKNGSDCTHILQTYFPKLSLN